MTESQAPEKTVSLTAFELKILWIEGIFSDTAYIALALKLNEHRYQNLRSFDIASFVAEWQAEQEDVKGNPKTKTLNQKSVKDAIDKMNAAELTKTQEQMSLQLNW